DCSDSYHDCYLKVFKLIQRRDKTMASAFNDQRRSSAFILLANINAEGLLTEEELAQFSSEMREALEVIDRIRRRLTWRSNGLAASLWSAARFARSARR
ncbi:MAG: hypothetical protein ABR577_19160, partial [Pyrinomonadaceae bacterium]